jgi:hypothetical protein
MFTTEAATSVATTVLCSALIVTRIYKMSIPNHATYSKVTAMIIESASLYSIAAVLMTAFQFLESERALEAALYVESFFTAMIVSLPDAFYIHEAHQRNLSVSHQLSSCYGSYWGVHILARRPGIGVGFHGGRLYVLK